MTRWVLYDQLWMENAVLTEGDPRQDRIVMIESEAFFRKLRHHQVKLAFFLSAMRHFAEELREAGWTVDYYRYDDAPSYPEALLDHVRKHSPDEIRVLAPNDYQLDQALPKIARKIHVHIEKVPTNQFLVTREEFAKWAKGSKSLRMETHYRQLRKKSGWLMQKNGQPEGGEWNFDKENRHSAKDWEKAGRPTPSKQVSIDPDDLTREVIEAVARDFPDHPGDAHRLWLPVTRRDSLDWLTQFIRDRLGEFGPYEDMMATGEPVLYHSVLSPMLNIGLLTPQECIEAAIEAYHRKSGPPIASVEGFVRQIMGWREFINGVYWLRMPEYHEVNELQADSALPEWFWTFESPMNCLHETLGQLKQNGYNHHIQRLMVLGNYFLLTGCHPNEVLDWYTALYVDAHEWVMAANVLGMVLHADGGYMATKPYAAGSGYINRMSDHCAGCQYKPSVKTGPEACPFNYLYWAFYDRHQKRFEKNPRVATMIRNWEKRSEKDRKAVRESAAKWMNAHHQAN